MNNNIVYAENVVTGEGWVYERPSKEEEKNLIKEIDTSVLDYFKRTNQIILYGRKEE